MYLTAAAAAFVGVGPLASVFAGDAAPRGEARLPDGSSWDGRFRYRRQLVDGRDAVLEFETTMGGKYVNGVDMIACDDDGLITDFKVMVRPLQAMDAVREHMLAALDHLEHGAG